MLFMKLPTNLHFGVDLIDHQHAMLVEIINDLLSALSYRRDEAIRLSPLLSELSQYAYSHFNTEERLMQIISYPNLNMHRRLHANLMDDLDEISYRLYLGVATLSEFVNFLGDWISKHVCLEDVNLAEYYQQTGMGRVSCLAIETVSANHFNSMHTQP